MRFLHKLAFRIPAMTLFAGALALAQTPASKPLIVEKVDENQLVTLKGNTPPAATAKNDLGRVNAGMPMSDLILVLRRSPEMQAAFDAFVESQYEPSSQNFHQWLTPEQVGERFGPAISDIGKVSAWLASHGLSVDGVSKDRMTIRFSGTAGRVEAAFHTELHNLTVRGVPHFSNMTDPQIPMALEPVVLGPKALNNFIPHPLHRIGGKVLKDPKTGLWRRVGQPVAQETGVRPDMGFTSCDGSSCLLEDLTPFDFAAIYNVAPLWTAGINGTGETIAIAGRSDVRTADVNSFRSTFGLSGGTFNTIHNGTDPNYCTSTSSTASCTLDDQIENALDVEWSGAIAPKATIDLVVTQQTSTNDSIYESASYIINHNVANIINVSYGSCELFLQTSGNAAYNTLWQTAASMGIAVFVASGDTGSPACDVGGDANGTPYSAQYGLAVSGIASTPYDTAVGGTDLNWGTTASPYWNSSNSGSNGSTAKGYMPEVTWNDSCTNPLFLSYIQSKAKLLQNNGINVSSPTDAESACNFVVNWWSEVLTLSGTNISFLVDTTGGGGGASNCTTNSSTDTTIGTCSASGYGKPSWQTGVTGIPNDGKRDIPDVSFFAGNGFNGSAYLICVSDWGGCVTSTSNTAEPVDAQGNPVNEIGGTSAASPAMAGVMALINQKAGSAQGNPNSQLYALAAAQNYSSCKTESVTNSSSCYFNDIDTNTIAMPCVAGSPNCTVNTAGDSVGVLSGFAAGVGFDNATGLGSLNVANVVNGWTATVTGTATATVAVSANPTTFTTVQGTTVTVAVSGGSGTPTGTVNLTSGGFGSATKTLDGSGSATFNLSPGALAVGTDTITAHYSGDAVYAAATGTTQVTVTQVGYTITASSPGASIAPGGTATSTITVTSVGGYTGSVALACAVTSSPAGAVHAPTCGVTGSPITLTAGTTTGTATATVSTTAATSASMAKPKTGGWAEAGGGAILALLVFFGIPARRREWRAVLGVVVLLCALGCLAACGGGGGSNTGGGGNPGTTAGTYTITVTPTGNPQISPNPIATFNVTVN